jgi:hypothetical protein
MVASDCCNSANRHFLERSRFPWSKIHFTTPRLLPAGRKSRKDTGLPGSSGKTPPSATARAVSSSSPTTLLCPLLPPASRATTSCPVKPPAGRAIRSAERAFPRGDRTVLRTILCKLNLGHHWAAEADGTGSFRRVCVHCGKYDSHGSRWSGHLAGGDRPSRPDWGSYS